MSDEIRFLGDLQRLDLKPGDRFVLTCEHHLSEDAHKRIQETWKRFMGGDDAAGLLIIESGMKIGVINDGTYDAAAAAVA